MTTINNLLETGRIKRSTNKQMMIFQRNPELYECVECFKSRTAPSCWVSCYSRKGILNHISRYDSSLKLVQDKSCFRVYDTASSGYFCCSLPGFCVCGTRLKSPTLKRYQNHLSSKNHTKYIKNFRITAQIELLNNTILDKDSIGHIMAFF